MITKISKRLMLLLNDPRGSVNWYINDNIWTKLNQFFSTLWCYLTAFSWGVRLGSKGRFHGVARFRRYPNSLISIGNNCTFLSSITANPLGLNHPCMITTWYARDAEILIGNNCGFSGSTIGATNSIHIGNHVICGPNTTIFDTDGHAVSTSEKGKSDPIIIEDHVWLGMNCVVLKGVTIGHHTVVAANSVVTNSLPPNVLAAGTPARVIRSLSE
jgi:hypothetical protein